MLGFEFMDLSTFAIQITHRRPTRISVSLEPGADVPRGTLSSEIQQLPLDLLAILSVQTTRIPLVGSTCARMDDVDCPFVPLFKPMYQSYTILPVCNDIDGAITLL